MKPLNCTICSKPIVLVPSAEERAKSDVTGKSAAYYRSLFTAHAQCQINRRERETLLLVQKS